jgi:hypothetical protein
MIYKTLIRPVLIYASETRILTKKNDTPVMDLRERFFVE